MFRHLVKNVCMQSAQSSEMTHSLARVRQSAISAASKIHKEISICSKPFALSCVGPVEFSAHITVCNGAHVHLYSWPLFGK
jgi:hypothetical protein